MPEIAGIRPGQIGKRGTVMEKLIDNCMKLGFGMMRLPRISDGDKQIIDIEQTKDMVDAFIKAGGKYVDTAFVY